MTYVYSQFGVNLTKFFLSWGSDLGFHPDTKSCWVRPLVYPESCDAVRSVISKSDVLSDWVNMTQLHRGQFWDLSSCYFCFVKILIKLLSKYVGLSTCLSIFMHIQSKLCKSLVSLYQGFHTFTNFAIYQSRSPFMILAKVLIKPTVPVI